MSAYEVFVCDDCGETSRDEPGDGWAQNVDGDDFCAKCALTLDPPEDDDDRPSSPPAPASPSAEARA